MATDMFGITQGAVQGASDPYGISAGANQGAMDPSGAVLASVQAAGGAWTLPQRAAWMAAQGLGGSSGEAAFTNAVNSYPLSTYPSQGGSAEQSLGGAPQGGTSDGLTAIGSGPGSAGYDQMASSFFNQPTSSGGSSGGGGGGGSGGGGSISMANPPGATSNPAGLFSSMMNNSTDPNVNPAFTNTSMPGASQVGYSAPATAPGGAPQGGGVLAMQQSNPQNALNAYQNTAGYQLLNAPGSYQQSPGYQFAVNDALGQVQANAASRGLLESGRVMRDMTDRASGMAMQDYGNWWNRQSQQYSDYQNRLAGLAGGPTGSEQAMTLGTNLGNASMQTGNNLASLFGNQASTGLGAMVNTGAAQANAMSQAGNTQAQINAANQSTKLAGAIAMNKGQF